MIRTWMKISIYIVKIFIRTLTTRVEQKFVNIQIHFDIINIFMRLLCTGSLLLCLLRALVARFTEFIHLCYMNSTSCILFSLTIVQTGRNM
jgi:hypothetical protein